MFVKLMLAFSMHWFYISNFELSPEKKKKGSKSFNGSVGRCPWFWSPSSGQFPNYKCKYYGVFLQHIISGQIICNNMNGPTEYYAE